MECWARCSKTVRLSSFKFLGMTVAEDLFWAAHIASAVGKAQHRLFYLRKLRSYHIPRPPRVNFYNCAISSVLMYGFLMWFSSSSKVDQQALQRVVKTATNITWIPLPEISTIYTTPLSTESAKHPAAPKPSCS